MNQEIGKKLLSILKVEQVKKDEPMKNSHNIPCGRSGKLFCDTRDGRRSCKSDRGVHTGKCSLLYSRKWK